MIINLLQHQVIFCGGKGGVGKTTVSGALALLAARQGKRVLLVSTDPAHSLGDLLETRLDDRPKAVEAGLWAVELDPERAADEYIAGVTQRLRDYVKPALYGEIERQMKLAREAPGAIEAALLERVAALIAEPPQGHDLIIFDTAPTGHTLRLLSLPESMAAWVEGLAGARRRGRSLADAFHGFAAGRRETADEERQARLASALEKRRRLFVNARERLRDPAVTAFVLVMTPERLPIEESRRAYSSLCEAGINVAGLLVNRVIPDDIDGDFLRQRREVERGYLEEIAEHFPDLPSILIPLMPRDVTRRHHLNDIVARFD